MRAAILPLVSREEDLPKMADNDQAKQEAEKREAEQRKQREAQQRAQGGQHGAMQQGGAAREALERDRARTAAGREASLDPPQASGKPTPTPDELAAIQAGEMHIDDKEPDGSPEEGAPPIDESGGPVDPAHKRSMQPTHSGAYQTR